MANQGTAGKRSRFFATKRWLALIDKKLRTASGRATMLRRPNALFKVVQYWQIP
jgi:hypothetical protein